MNRRVGLCFLLLLSACIYGSFAMAARKSFMDEVRESEAPFDNRTVPLEKQVIEETVVTMSPNNDEFFRVLARKKQIGRYKCSSCHTDKPVKARQGLELTHSDVVLQHGLGGRALVCIDCHHREERDYLEDKKGRKIDFDHSYQLCGQCHFRQKRDWLAGAHGKRVANWAGERVVYNCATCHNPHSPRFEKRFPATYSVPLD
ncbi:hypothetical protein [Desulfosediminicola ganghwensis]|uniref:hypothetical protein n=1 Tax=Desulfosediminicola ganghwensis TaxID=2569540 RepID=UPI0010AD90CF|nr:hypothetical protein [Desulfosediminicola ganghwensis]